MPATGYTSGDPRKLARTGYTKGDVVAADATGALTAVPVGADTEVLTADSTDAEGVDWAAGGGGGGGVPSNTVVTETSYGQASTAGAAATFSRGDHTHGSPSLTNTAPATTEGIGQAAAVGVAVTPARADHVHPMAAAGAPAASAPGDAQATGAATTFAASDHVHAREAFAAPAASAVGDTQSAGAASTVARSDHRHAREAFGAVTAQTTFGQASSNGAATTVARSDHVHGTPATPTASDVGAIASSLVDAKGDVVTATADNTPARLGVGSDGQVLRAASGQATGLQWDTLDAADVGAAAAAHTHAGADIASGTVAYARLPAGTTASTVAAGDDTRFRDTPAYPASGYGLLAVSADPMHHQGSAGIGSDTIWATRLWIPANVAITNLWAAVRVAGTHDGATAGNRLGLYDDTGAQVDTTASDNTLWTGTGWRGGALQGGPVAAQSAGRFVYILWITRGLTVGVSLPYPSSADDSNAVFASIGVGGGKRRAMWTGGSALPASFDPTSYGTNSGFLSLVGVS